MVSGGLAFFAVTRPWWLATVTTAGMPETDVAVSGSSVAPWAVGAALLVAAAALGILAGSALIRRLIGVLVMIVSVGALVGIVMASGADAQQSALDVAAVSGANADWQSTIWRAVAGLGFVIAASCGTWTTLKGQNWANMSARFDAPKKVRAADDSDAWKMIDEGIDPTE